MGSIEPVQWVHRQMAVVFKGGTFTLFLSDRGRSMNGGIQQKKVLFLTIQTCRKPFISERGGLALGIGRLFGQQLESKVLWSESVWFGGDTSAAIPRPANYSGLRPRPPQKDGVGLGHISTRPTSES